MIKKLLLFSTVGLFFTQINLQAQNVGIGTSAPSEKLHVVGNARITVLSGTGTRMVVANASGVLGTQAIPDGGDITGVTAGAGLIGGGTAGNVTLTANANNGLYVNAGADRIRMGGPLVENTTITQANFSLTHNLTGTGDFRVQDAGVTTFEVRDDGTTRFGDDVYWLDANSSGTLLGVFSDDGDDGRFRMYENGVVSMDLDMNSQFIFNEQGLDRNFRVESDGVASMFFVDAGLNRVGIGTGVPVDRLEVAGGRVEFTATTDANGTAGTGVLEIANSLRIDGNEIITNTNTPLYLQSDNAGDLIVDGNSFMVDASTNRVGLSTGAPSRTLDVNGLVRIRGGVPNAGDVLMSQDNAGNATWSNAGYGMVPIGSIIAWHGNIGGGVGGLPTGWVECVGGAVADGASPINGRPIPNLNNGTTSDSGDGSRGRFLRGNTISGILQTDQTNNLEQIQASDSDQGIINGTTTVDDDGNWSSFMATSRDGGDRDPLRFRVAGVENRVTNMSVRWIMRIK
jgi:hypothetical protein